MTKRNKTFKSSFDPIVCSDQVDCVVGLGHNQDTPVLSALLLRVRSGLLELDLNYSFTDRHCVLGKQKPLHSRSPNLVSSSNTFEVDEKGEKDRNKTLFRLIISD